MLASQPSWVPHDCYAAYDFIHNRWYNGYVGTKTVKENGGSADDGGGYAAQPFTPQRNGILLAGSTSGFSENRITDLGLFSERASTNYCLNARDLTQPAWNTVTTATVLKDQVGNDTTSIKAGTSSCSSILATGANAIVTQDISGTSGLVQRAYTASIAVAGTGYATNEVDTTTGGTFTTATKIKVNTQTGGVPQTIQVNNLTSYTVIPSNPVSQGSTTGSGTGLTVNITFESFVFSAYVKRLTGSGTIWMTSGNGVWTDITSQINSNSFTWITNLPQINNLNTYTVGFKLGTSGDKIAVDFCQFEPCVAVNNAVPFLPSPTGGMPTTPLVTVGSIATRNNETAYWGINGTTNDGQKLLNEVFSYGGPWSVIMAMNGDMIGSGSIFLASDMTNPTSFSWGGGIVGFGGLANKTTNVANVGRGSWNIGAVCCDAKGTTFCLNGGAVSTNNVTTLNNNAGSWTSASLTSNLAAIIAVTNGNWKVTINGIAQNLAGMNFTSCTTLPQVAAVLQAALTSCIVTATASVLTLTVLGANATIAVATFAGGTDMNGAGLFAGASGTVLPAATHFNIANNGSGTTNTQLNGSVGFAYFFRRHLSPAELQLYTDLNGPLASFN